MRRTPRTRGESAPPDGLEQMGRREAMSEDTGPGVARGVLRNLRSPLTRAVHALVVCSLLVGSGAPGAVLASQRTTDDGPQTTGDGWGPVRFGAWTSAGVRGLSSAVRSSRSVVRGPFFPVRGRPSAQPPPPPPNPPLPTR